MQFHAQCSLSAQNGSQQNISSDWCQLFLWVKDFRLLVLTTRKLFLELLSHRSAETPDNIIQQIFPSHSSYRFRPYFMIPSARDQLSLLILVWMLHILSSIWLGYKQIGKADTKIKSKGQHLDMQAKLLC